MRNIGSVVKLPSGSYRIEYNVKGKRYRKTVKAKNITEARKYLHDFISSINNNTFQDKVSIRFDEFAAFWFEKHAKQNLSPTTVAGYKTILNKRVLPAIGDVYLSDITKIQIQDILSDLKKDGLTSKTQKRYWSVISSILSYAVENDYLKYNVAASIKIRPDSTEHKTEMQIYDHSELELLYNALDKEDDKVLVDMIMLDLLTGLRRGEIMGLQPKDYDPKEGTLTISRTKVKNGGTPIIKDTKNHKSRTFILPDKAREILERNIEYKADDDFIFDMHPDTFSKNFKKFLKRNNLKDIRVYDLRHTNASMLHSEGIDYATIASRIGNLPSTTANFYIHKVSEKDKEASDKLNEIFKR